MSADNSPWNNHIPTGTKLQNFEETPEKLPEHGLYDSHGAVGSPIEDGSGLQSVKLITGHMGSRLFFDLQNVSGSGFCPVRSAPKYFGSPAVPSNLVPSSGQFRLSLYNETVPGIKLGLHEKVHRIKLDLFDGNGRNVYTFIGYAPGGPGEQGACEGTFYRRM